MGPKLKKSKPFTGKIMKGRSSISSYFSKAPKVDYHSSYGRFKRTDFFVKIFDICLSKTWNLCAVILNV
ncbi:unnamed protein product [Ectocarpus sp. CCAP 1310/34]|nr:unnamed protein product [Ectocarpus sp. CCAP 1310/34]